MTPVRPAARSVVCALIAVASAAPARADEPSSVPAGHFYFGASFAAVQPFGRALVSREPLTTGIGGGWYAHYESDRFLVGAEISGARFGHDDTYSNPLLFALRAGAILPRGHSGVYVSAGPAMMAYGNFGDDAAGAFGLSFEVGALLFRDKRWLRLTPYLQTNLPALPQSGGKGAAHVGSLGWGAAGVRVQF